MAFHSKIRIEKTELPLIRQNESCCIASWPEHFTHEETLTGIGHTAR